MGKTLSKQMNSETTDYNNTHSLAGMMYGGRAMRERAPHAQGQLGAAQARAYRHL